ncbi:MAG TPA: hypothetical protein VK009_20460, partial [Chloroflexota bacterium]|nr:hypothetical protein [Chloroflexota bacterium]
QPVTAGGSGDRLLLGGVQVTRPERPPSLDELRIPHPLDRSFGAVRLLGYGLTLVGQDAERTSFAAGDQVELTLFWQADARPSTDASLAVELRGGSAPLFSGKVIASHPTSTWLAGDRYREQHRLTLPASSRGEHDLVVRIGDSAPVRLTQLSVR